MVKCGECGSEMIMDLATLNKGCWWCPTCHPLPKTDVITIIKRSERPEDIYADFVKQYEGYWIKKHKEAIKEFVKTLDHIMERIEFHTDNPDSELMDEIAEIYKEYEEKKTIDE